MGSATEFWSTDPMESHFDGGGANNSCVNLCVSPDPQVGSNPACEDPCGLNPTGGTGRGEVCSREP